MSEYVILNNVRASFIYIDKPYAGEFGSPEYKSDFIMPEDHQGYKDFFDLYTKIAKEKFGDKAKVHMQSIHEGEFKYRCYGKGETKKNKATMQVYDGYAENCFLVGKNKDQPIIFDRNGNKVDKNDPIALSNHAQEFYSGCYVKAIIVPETYVSKYARHVKAKLIAIQFLEHGEPLGGGNAPSVEIGDDVFGKVSVDESKSPAPASAPLGATDTEVPDFLGG